VTNQVSGKYVVGLQWQAFIADQLSVWNADGTFVRSIANLPGTQSIGSDWSPTQDRICFAANGSAGSSIYIEGPDGSNPSLLHPAPLVPLSDVTLCRWSPDGSRVAFVQLSENAFGGWWSDLYVINSTGDPTSLRQLTHNSPGNFADVPTWSPDGHALAYEVDVNPGYPVTPIPQSVDLFAVDPSTLAVVQLTNDHRSSSPAWGPGETFTRTVSPALPSSATTPRLGAPPAVPHAPPGPRLWRPAAQRQGSAFVPAVSQSMNELLGGLGALSSLLGGRQRDYLLPGFNHLQAHNVGWSAPS
jgi:Tol biopolymer transport system component